MSNERAGQKTTEGLEAKIDHLFKIIEAMNSKEDNSGEQAQEYRSNLIDCIRRLRNNELDNWGWKEALVHLFDQTTPPRLFAIRETNLTPKVKLAIVREVL